MYRAENAVGNLARPDTAKAPQCVVNGLVSWMVAQTSVGAVEREHVGWLQIA